VCLTLTLYPRTGVFFTQPCAICKRPDHFPWVAFYSPHASAFGRTLISRPNTRVHRQIANSPPDRWAVKFILTWFSARSAICHNLHVCGRYRLSRRKQFIAEHFDSIPGEDDWSRAVQAI
jgi:hypothetical protein